MSNDEFFEVITDAVTGEQTIRPFTPEEIAAALKERVPASITPRQCRILLLQRGLLSQVETMIAQQNEDVRITWEYAIEFRRDDPLLNQLAPAINLTEAQLDQFFIDASMI